VPKRRSSERNYTASVKTGNRYLEVISAMDNGTAGDFIVNRIQSTFGVTQWKGRRREEEGDDTSSIQKRINQMPPSALYVFV